MDWTWSYGLSRFRDRRDAGRQLAARLHDYRGRPDVLVRPKTALVVTPGGECTEYGHDPGPITKLSTEPVQQKGR
jgi:hypothetical protein